MESKSNLEGKVGVPERNYLNQNCPEIVDLDLNNFVSCFKLRVDRTITARYVEGLIGNLYSTDGKFYSKGIRTVGDLYRLTQEEMTRMPMYGKRTFVKLNELLTGKGLPPLQLPKEYTSFPQISG